MNINKLSKKNTRNSDVILPHSDALNIPALSKIFNKTTNSYKFLFFISLLDIAKMQGFSGGARQVSYVDLTIEMLANAWPLYVEHGLSFGTQDTIASKLDDLELKFHQPLDFAKDGKQSLRKAMALADLKQARRLMDFVPYRLLTPFLEDELVGVDKGDWLTLELALPTIANKHFLTKKPVYRFDSDVYKDCESVIIHPEWNDYFGKNFAAIYDWALSCWVGYMEKRNPQTSGIAAMIFDNRR